jgi:phospholipase/carboxylesterase
MKFDSESWVLERSTFADLDCILILPRTADPKSLVVLCHGFGAPGTDLVNLAEELVPLLSGEAPETSPAPAFLFPEGLVDLSDEFGMEGPRAWWQINMAKLAQMQSAASYDELHNEVPEGIETARRAVEECILACIEAKNWKTIDLVIGGFSQGAMLSVELAMRASRLAPKALILWSGALICQDVWREANRNKHKALPVFQSHGLQDNILPISTGRALKEFLHSQGLQIDYVEFHGPHTIAYESLQGSATLIDKVLKG